jgi:hypothetical protein
VSADISSQFIVDLTRLLNASMLFTPQTIILLVYHIITMMLCTGCHTFIILEYKCQLQVLRLLTCTLSNMNRIAYQFTFYRFLIPYFAFYLPSFNQIYHSDEYDVRCLRQSLKDQRSSSISIETKIDTIRDIVGLFHGAVTIVSSLAIT